jgi:hypothetical protein
MAERGGTTRRGSIAASPGGGGGTELGVGGGAPKGATDAIVDDRRRSKGDGGPAGCSEAVGATVRSGGGATVRTGGGGLPEEDREAADSDKSKSDWETTRRDLWCLTTGVACLAPARLVSS